MKLLLPLALAGLLSTATLAAPSPCPDDMAAFDGYCIDRYEAPNIKGEKPFAFKIAQEGEKWCEERGKKLCNEDQWYRACRGSEGRKYPYGVNYVKSACNDDKIWKVVNWTLLGKYPSPAAIQHAQELYQADPSGDRADCKTPEDVFDLTGNVAEWVTRSYVNATNYGHVMKGCFWSGCFGGTAPSCGFANTAHPGNFRSYETGFRCCKDRD